MTFIPLVTLSAPAAVVEQLRTRLTETVELTERLEQGRGLTQPHLGWRMLDIDAVGWAGSDASLSVLAALGAVQVADGVHLRLDDAAVRLRFVDLSGYRELAGRLSDSLSTATAGAVILDLPAAMVERAVDLLTHLAPEASVTAGNAVPAPAAGAAPRRAGATAGLNDQQLAVVHAPLDRHVLVNAGAGTGKTHTLAHRVAYLVGHEGVPPESMLALTFTRAAAERINTRLKQFAAGGNSGVDFVPVSTFHSLALRILRLAVSQRYSWLQRNFRLMDPDRRAARSPDEYEPASLWRETAATLFAGLADDLTDDERLTVYPLALDRLRDGAAEHGVRVNGESLPNAELRINTPHGTYRVPAASIALVWDRYYAELRSRNVIDFAGAVAESIRVLETYSDLLALATAVLRFIIVDEFQDTTRAQIRLLSVLASRGAIINAAGDGDQAIMSFAGAAPDSMLRFASTFAGADRPTPATLPLEVNYRASAPILEIANGVIARNELRLSRSLTPASADGLSDCDAVTRLHAESPTVDAGPWLAQRVRELLAAGTAPNEIAVLYRKETERYPQRTNLLDALTQAGIAVGGGGVTVGTVHSAKGSEFDNVFVYFLDRQQFPDQRADVEEERRLLYVAVTRARKRLFIVGRPSGGSPDFFAETAVPEARFVTETRKSVAASLAASRPELMDELLHAMAEDPFDVQEW